MKRRETVNIGMLLRTPAVTATPLPDDFQPYKYGGKKLDRENGLAGIIIAIIAFILCSCHAKCETCMKQYQVMSIDTLKNHVYVVYLKRADGIYKAFSQHDTLMKDTSTVLLKTGQVYPLSLTSAIKWRKKYEKNYFAHHRIPIVRCRGNFIPVDSQIGTLNDLYVIDNCNGLYLYSTSLPHIIDPGPIEHRSDKFNDWTQDPVLPLDSVLNIINRNLAIAMSCAENEMNMTDYVIYVCARVSYESRSLYQGFHCFDSKRYYLYSCDDDEIIIPSEKDFEFHNPVQSVIDMLDQYKPIDLIPVNLSRSVNFCRAIIYIKNGVEQFRVFQPDNGDDKYPSMGPFLDEIDSIIRDNLASKLEHWIY